MRAAALVCLVLGLGLMLPFETVPTRVAGVAALFAFMVLGLFVIADPADLEREDPS